MKSCEVMERVSVFDSLERRIKTRRECLHRRVPLTLVLCRLPSARRSYWSDHVVSRSSDDDHRRISTRLRTAFAVVWVAAGYH